MKKTLFAAVSMVLVALMELTACSEDDYASKLPVFDRVELQPTQAAPSESVTATLYFSDPGSYIKGTYVWKLGSEAQDTIIVGTQSQYSFSFTIPESTPAGNYTFSITPTRIAAYAGSALYLDPSPMGNVSTPFTVTAP